MPRELKRGFLQEYCDYSADTEIPSMFTLWGGISAIAGALGRDCHVELGHYNIYPNLYVVFVAGSARCHKSTAIGITEKFLRSVEPPLNMTQQKGTPEALIQALTEAPPSIQGTLITPRAEGIAIISELSTLIDRNSFQNGMISLLTELWDSPRAFEYRTRGRGKETLNNCCLNVLGGSTAQWLKEAIPVVAIGGGFTSRVIFVFVEHPEKLVAFPEMSEENKRRKVLLQRELNHISKIHGNFRLSSAARAFFKSDYEEFHSGHELLDDKYTEGYAGRRHTIMLKLGMILSASERDTKIITESDLQVALRLLEDIEEGLPTVMNAITSEAQGDICKEVLVYISRRKTVRQAQIMKKFSGRLNNRELAIVLETLIEMRVIARDPSQDNPLIVYTERKLQMR